MLHYRKSVQDRVKARSVIQKMGHCKMGHWYSKVKSRVMQSQSRLHATNLPEMTIAECMCL